MKKGKQTGFTLIELLIVIAIISIISVVVVVTLNAPEMLRQARDGSRITDMKTLSGAVGLYVNEFPNGGLGSKSTIYVSLPDKTLSGNATSTCTSIGLPTPPAGYIYQCVSPQSLRDVDGTGWTPVNLKQMTSGSPISNLPIDPSNVSSTGLYYTYATDGANYVFTAIPESQKQKQALASRPQMPNYPDVMAQGSDVTLSPLFSTNGLIGYWPLDEGTGTVVQDMSGNNNVGSWNGTASYAVGKVGAYAGNLNGNSYINISDSPTLELSSAMTISFWEKTTVSTTTYFGLVTKYGSCTGGQCGYDIGGPYAAHRAYFNIRSASNGNSLSAATQLIIDDGSWHNIVGIFNGTQLIVYGDGVAGSPISWSYSASSSSAPFQIGARGGGSDFPGQIDDIRIYNRALSVSEIQAIYNAEK